MARGPLVVGEIAGSGMHESEVNMAHAKTLKKIRIRKSLPMYGGGTLPAGTEIALTDDWETIPPNVRGRVILEPHGERRLVVNEDLEYALGAH